MLKANNLSHVLFCSSSKAETTLATTVNDTQTDEVSKVHVHLYNNPVIYCVT